MDENKKNSFEKIIYNALIVLLVSSTILFFILGFKLNEEFFIKYSVDKILKASTIQRIHSLQQGMILFSILIFIATMIIIRSKFRVISFLRKHKTIVQNILLLLCVIIIIIVTSETILGWQLSEKTFGSGFGPNSIRFNAEHVHLNTDKMRDREFSVLKPKNTIRIAGLGDSFTFGSGVKNVNDTFLKLIEKKLNSQEERNVQYEVLNFGIAGRDTEDELNILKEKALKYNPDIIIISYVLNDFKNVDPAVKVSKKYVEIIPFASLWLRNILYSYAIAEMKLNKIIEKLGLKTAPENVTLIEFESDINKRYNAALFDEIGKITRERDKKVVVVIFPVLYQLKDYMFSEIHEFVRNASEKNGFFVIDLYNTYKEYDESEIIVNKYDTHPNELGHRIAADAIFESLIKNKIV